MKYLACGLFVFLTALGCAPQQKDSTAQQSKKEASMEKTSQVFATIETSMGTFKIELFGNADRSGAGPPAAVRSGKGLV